MGHLKMKLALTIALGLMISTASVDGSTARTKCSDDYSPCSCSQDGVDVFVTCTDVQPEQIKEAFSRTSYPVLKEVAMVLPADAGRLPADLLSRKLAEIIRIRGSGRDSFQLTIDFAAFSPSKSKTTLFEITDADLSLLSFGFLDEFSVLQSLYLTRISGIRVIGGVPLLQSLDEMFVNDCLGFTEFSEFPFGSFPNLKVLHLTNNQDLYDDKLAIILTALDSSIARDNLNELAMDANRLTHVPLRLPNFPNLQKVSITSNNIEFLQVNSFASAKFTYFNIQSNSLDLVEPGAFNGEFSASKFYLDFNNLTFFYEPVYKPLLQSMYDANQGGLLSINQNPIVCDCTIAWLIARNQNLLRNIDNQAKCSNGHLFTQLNENDYDETSCPQANEASDM